MRTERSVYINTSPFNTKVISVVFYMHIVIINGPNLNLLGLREPQLYGSQTMEEYLQQLSEQMPDVEIDYYQSNHEGDLIDWLHENGFSAHGIVLNAGGYTHTSVALRDAIVAINTPVVEVHITDLSKREIFRQTNMLTDVCVHTIMGHGLNGYKEAIEWLKNM